MFGLLGKEVLVLDVHVEPEKVFIIFGNSLNNYDTTNLTRPVAS